MMRRLSDLLDPFILALLSTVLVASLLPPRGGFVPVADGIADAAIVLLFFLHGAKLSRDAIVSGLLNWRLHLTVLAATFVMFPALGAAIRAMAVLPGTLAAGLLFLTLLPSTINSSIAFTAMARGNVAAAVCTASFSTLLGIFVTPLLAFLLMGGTGVDFSLGTMAKLFAQLLLPFGIGHLLRPLVGSFVGRHKDMVSWVDRGAILMIVYTAFGASVVEGLWQRVAAPDLVLLCLICLVLLAIVLLATRTLGRVLSLPREDAIVLLFAGSKKSLASGVPIAGVLFGPADVGAILLPVIIFHQFQLTACALIARRLSREAEEPPHLSSR